MRASDGFCTLGLKKKRCSSKRMFCEQCLLDVRKTGVVAAEAKYL